jgi:hypothetical protein
MFSIPIITPNAPKVKSLKGDFKPSLISEEVMR